MSHDNMKATYKNETIEFKVEGEICNHCGTLWEDELARLTCPCLEFDSLLKQNKKEIK